MLSPGVLQINACSLVPILVQCIAHSAQRMGLVYRIVQESFCLTLSCMTARNVTSKPIVDCTCLHCKLLSV